MRLVGYARVSTNGQALQGTSVPEQERAMREWCEANGHELVGVRIDNGVTGTTIERPGLADALLDVEDGRADGLLVRELDRLARALHVQEAALAAVWALGGRTFEVGHGEVMRDDPDDPYRTFIRQVIGAAAQLEASMTRMRLQRGRRSKHGRGGYAGGLTVGYGQQVEGVGPGAVRVTVPEDALVIESMRQLRADGETFAHIAERLNAEGVETARGGRWHDTTVRRIIGREARGSTEGKGSVERDRKLSVDGTANALCSQVGNSSRTDFGREGERN